MKEKTCCFTGHRDIIVNECALRAKLKTEVENLIENGVIYFLSGGARGFDTIASECVLELKDTYPHIKLILIIPCVDHNKGWKEPDIVRFEKIKEQTDEVRVLSQHYYKGCMHMRNRYMVDKSAFCVCFLRRKSGGTFYTESYARKRNLNIIYI